LTPPLLDAITKSMSLSFISSEPLLQVNHLSVVFAGSGPETLAAGREEDGALEALKDVSFELEAGSFACVIGASGSGKSTLLRVLAGLVKPTSGEVRFWRACGGGRPKVGLVFQQANLMPWRTVLENIMLPFELKKASRAEAEARALELLELVGLAGFERSWPRDLSGGMAQRVAIARSLMHDPDLLLLDEPFGALDALTRERMGAELLRIWQARRKTVLMVTHSINEALFLSDRVLVLSSRPGQVCLDLKVPLPRPRSEAMHYTAEFGEMARCLRAAIDTEAAVTANRAAGFRPAAAD